MDERGELDNRNSTAPLTSSSLQAEVSTGTGGATGSRATPTKGSLKRSAPRPRKKANETQNEENSSSSSKGGSLSSDSIDGDSEGHGLKPPKKRLPAARTKPSLPRSRNMNKTRPRLPPKFIIQEWHVVLGDTHARPDRTTKATELLRNVKDKFKKKWKGEKKSTWIPLALQEFEKRLENELFPPSKYPGIPKQELGLVLVRCTPKSMERVAEPYLYGYKGDTEALFGIAQAKQALEFFLISRDAPNLSHELERHRQNLKQLRNSDDPPPADMMEDFQNTLDFFQSKLESAEKESILSTNLLECLKPINTLKEQWKLLISHKNSIVIQTAKNPAKTAEEDKSNENSENESNDFNEDQTSGRMGASKEALPKEDVRGSGSMISSRDKSSPQAVSTESPGAVALSPTPKSELGSPDRKGISQCQRTAALLHQMKRQQTLVSSMPDREVSDTTSSLPARSLTNPSVSKEDSFRWHKNAPQALSCHSDPSKGLASQHRDTPSSKRVKKADPESGETRRSTETEEDDRPMQSSQNHPQVFYISNVVTSQTRMHMASYGFFPHPFIRYEDMKRPRGT